MAVGTNRALARARWLAAAAAAAALMAGMAAAPAQGATAGQAFKAASPQQPKPSADTGVFRPAAPAPVRPPASYEPMQTTWPDASSSTVGVSVVAVPQTGPAQVSSLLFAAPGSGLAAASAGPVLAGEVAGSPVSNVTLSVRPHAAAVASGVRGVILTAAATAGSAAGTARVGLSYAGFAQAYGGNYGASLGLAELPACALTNPARPACDKATLLASVNDLATQTVSAAVSLPARPAGTAAASAGPAVVLAASPAYTDGGGPLGTSNATSLRPTGTWTEGGSSGSFQYSYPMSVPPSAGGLDPQVSLDYDSGLVDGQTAATQAQSSWVGDGWTTSTDAYIEQTFTPCQDDPEGSAAPQATPDECYDGPVITLSLDGGSTPLVCPVPFSYTASSQCYASDDPGEVITHHVNSGNGQATKFTDYWTVTTTSGTTYTFGINHLPGWASGDPATNSVDSLPVFSAHSGDPCYNTNGFADSVCTMAYQWNLDYVTDSYGNAMAYFYDQATNAYTPYGASSAVSYDRDSYLGHILYGFTNGNAYATGASTAPADEVSFGTGDRCFTGTCDPLNSTTAPNWDDVPYANYCASGSTSCSINWPTFWSTVRLASVTASQWNGTAYTAVDSWALSQEFLSNPDSTSPTLWLSSITHTGEDSTAGATTGAAVTVPAVTFGAIDLPNRVNPGTYYALYRERIATITTETGSQIKVAYENTSPTCTPGNTPGTNYPASPAANTWSCFPVYWGTFTAGNPDWFYKYAVSTVQVTDPSGGSPGLYTSYGYASPAWHYDDNEVVEAQDRTYGQWRGYRDVYTFNGTGTDPVTETSTIYYQGMSDDNDATDVRVADLAGQDHEDADQLAGDALEQTAYDYGDTASPASPPVNNSQVYSYWVSAAAATRTRAGLPALTSNYTGVVEDWGEQEITDTSPATYRITETDTGYDTTTTDPDFGLPLFELDHGDVSQPSQASCTSLTYAAQNTTNNLTGLVAETEVDAAPCTGATADGISMPTAAQMNDLSAPAGISKPADVISDTRAYYDDPPVLSAGVPVPSVATWPQAPPGNSEASVVEKATNYASGAFSYQATAATAYDSYGRPVTAYDVNGNATTTAYKMTDGSTTAETVTNALGQATATTYDPARGLPVTETDPNGIVTTMQYDELGRLTSEWDNSRPTSETATDTYAYTFGTATTPTVVTTSQLNNSGGHTVSTALYDALLRLRQTQVPTPQGGVLVSDNFYESRGFLAKVNTNWWDPPPSGGSLNPSGNILTVPDSQVPDQTVTAYDGLGRAVEVTRNDDDSPVSTAYTQYTGDEIITVPAAAGSTPVGATPTATVTDALGRTTKQLTFTSWPTVTTGTNPGGFPTVAITGGTTEATTDAYDTRGWLASTTDVTSGEQWTQSYNLLGQVTATISPNAGTTTMSYDNDGNLVQTTDQAGHTITYTYDALDRETGEYDGTSSQSSPIATWTYDNSTHVPGVTNPIGQLTAETSYDQDGDAFTIQQTGFNVFGESLGEDVTVPADQGALAGTYTFGHTYDTIVGLPLRDSYPASPDGGSLPAETVSHTYIASFGLPNAMSGLGAYAQSTTYTAWSQVYAEEIGSGSDNADIENAYDPNTGNLTDTQVATNTSPTTTYDNTSYAYDPAGNITAETDVRDVASGIQTEDQCFDYNTLDQLTQAWTTNGTTACTAGPPARGSTVTDGIPGGAYWTQWTYNSVGDQTSQTGESTTGGSPVTTTYSYANAAQPDTLTSTSGGTTATYGYNADGDTTSIDQATGNQTLIWTDDGKLASDTTTAGTTTYIYDADGDLLAADNPASDTLYLPGEQLTATTTATGGVTVTGIRFLCLPGGGQIVRTGAGNSYYFETSDLNGTSLLALSNDTQDPVWRQFTPYGAPRSTPTGTWPDTNGYLGDPVNSNDGLTTIGARQYDPASGRFLSLDPILNTGNPSDMGGYAYAADNPVTNTDPTGLNVELIGGGCTDALDSTECNPPSQSPCQTMDIGCTNDTGSLGDLLGGYINFGYTGLRGLVGLAAIARLNPAAAPLGDVADWVLRHTPSRLPIGNPNTLLYNVGEGAGLLSSLLIPGGDELDVARAGGVVADDLAAAAAADADQVERQAAQIVEQSSPKASGAEADELQGQYYNEQRQAFDEANMDIYHGAENFAEAVQADYHGFEGSPQATGTSQPPQGVPSSVSVSQPYGSASINDPVIPTLIASAYMIRLAQLFLRDVVLRGKM